MNTELIKQEHSAKKSASTHLLLLMDRPVSPSKEKEVFFLHNILSGTKGREADLAKQDTHLHKHIHNSLIATMARWSILSSFCKHEKWHTG